MEVRQLAIRVDVSVYEQFQAFADQYKISQGEALAKLLNGNSAPSSPLSDVEGPLRELKRVIEKERISHVELMESLTSLARFTGSIQHEGRQFSEVTHESLNRMNEALHSSLQKLESMVQILTDSADTVAKGTQTFEEIQSTALLASKKVEASSKHITNSAEQAQFHAQKLTQSIEYGVKKISDSSHDLTQQMQKANDTYRHELLRTTKEFTQDIKEQIRNAFLKWGLGALATVLVSTALVSSFNYFDQRGTVKELKEEAKFLRDFYFYGIQQGCNGRKILVPEKVCTQHHMKGSTDNLNPLVQGN